jgi:hypothetical protein
MTNEAGPKTMGCSAGDLPIAAREPAQRGDCCWTRPPQVNLLIRCESLLALTIKCLAQNNKKQK